MKANVQNDIKIPKSGFNRSRLDWSHDVNTTFGWGEVQPTECKLLIPGSKTIVKNKSLVRFAPMVAPTFGRVRYKSFSQFVPLEDIFPNFASFMSQEPTFSGSKVQIADTLLRAPLAHLSSWALMGARATMYFAIDTNDGKTAAQNAALGNYITWYRQDPNLGSTQSDWQQHFDNCVNYTQSDRTFMFNEVDTFNSLTNQITPNITSVILSLYSLNGVFHTLFPRNCSIRLSAVDYHDLCPVRRDYKPDIYTGDKIVESYQREVTFENADFVLEGNVGSGGNMEYFAIAFEFSDFGKRIRKIIQGLGYQINLTSSKKLSVLPFLAEYKAYWDVFQPELYKGWETSFCYQFVKNQSVSFGVDPYCYPLSRSDIYAGANGYFNLFMLMEFSDQWYIERPDYYGAHLERLAVSPLPNTNGFLTVSPLGQLQTNANIDVETTIDGYTGESVTQVGTNSIDMAHPNLPYINTLFHTQIDATLLQRMSRWINKYSILGRAFDKIMRAFGLGKYLDAIDSKFIGNCDKMLTISDVVSYAATSDASLGEYGGKGLEYFEDGKQVFENDVYGYWITLSCVVPEAGYTQSLDSTLECVKKGDFYQADFDAIGMEATTKETLCSSQFIASDLSQSAVEHTFGFIPRLSKWKVHKNLVNGDFNRHSLRDVYLPYTLDKQLNVNDYSVRASDYNNPQGALIYNFVRLTKSKNTWDLPCAGIWSRTPTKYRWLGHFDRIFLKQDDEPIETDSVDTSLNQFVGWSDFNRDNFLFHCISDMICYAPVKPIEKSYGVDENEESPTQNGVEYVVKS